MLPPTSGPRSRRRPTTPLAGSRTWSCRLTGPAACPQVFPVIGEMVLDDLALMEQGLPPVRNQMAARELVSRYRSKPVQSVDIEE